MRRGLGSACTALHLMWEQEIANILGVPDEVMQVTLLSVAYTVGMGFKPAEPQPSEQIVSWDG